MIKMLAIAAAHSQGEYRHFRRDGYDVAITECRLAHGPYRGLDGTSEMELVPKGAAGLIVRANISRGPEIVRRASNPWVLVDPRDPTHESEAELVEQFREMMFAEIVEPARG